MLKRHSKNTEKQLIAIINDSNNLNKCGECGSDYPTWALWNLGMLLCGKCANCHKKVLSSGGRRGEPISRVKSLTLDVWSDSQIDSLRRKGNRAAQKEWNPKRVPFPYDDADEIHIDTYLRKKYVLGEFRYDDICSDKYAADDRRSASAMATKNSRSRSSSRSLPHLSHRKLTSYELSKYSSQARNIASLGYDDRDAVVESLILSKGDINTALDILNFDAQVNPTLGERPPELPSRPPGSAASSASGPIDSISSATNGGEWWGTAQATGSTGVITPFGNPVESKPPQIYQYTDPTTGQVSYVDSSGQQYLDPSNPQHQVLMMQTTTPQALGRQQTNQNILSLYNQPALTMNQPQQQQMQPQFTLQQTVQHTGQQLTQGLNQTKPQMVQYLMPDANVQNPYFKGQLGYTGPESSQSTQYGAQSWK